MIVKNKIYSFVVGENWLYAKTLNLEPPPAKYAYSIAFIPLLASSVLSCQHIPCADPFRAATFHVVDFSVEE